MAFDLEMEHITDCHIEIRDLSISHIRDEHGHAAHSVNPYVEVVFTNDPEKGVARTPAMRNNSMPVWPELRPLRYKVVWTFDFLFTIIIFNFIFRVLFYCLVLFY